MMRKASKEFFEAVLDNVERIKYYGTRRPTTHVMRLIPDAKPKAKEIRHKIEIPLHFKTTVEKTFSERRRPHILVCATGPSPSTITSLCDGLLKWADVHQVMSFATFPPNDDLAVELVKWADILLIAPLSDLILFKISTRSSDDLLTSIAKKWDTEKLFIVAPLMERSMWEYVGTKKCLKLIEHELNAVVIKQVCTAEIVEQIYRK